MTGQTAPIVADHDQQETSQFVEHFAAHDARSESEEFRHTKHHLEHDLGLGCAVCLMERLEKLIAEGKLPADPGDCTLSSGVKVAPLAWYLRTAGELGLYPEHDKPLESHHAALEWAHASQADWFKVNFYAQLMDWYGLYAEGLAAGRPPIASPDDDRTQLILCAEHHRGEGIGIHHVPLPAWGAQLVVRDGETVLEPMEGHHPILPTHQFGPHINK